MVSKCANPGCQAPFRYFHTGKLFRIDKESGYERRRLLGTEREAKKPARHLEFYWLCDDCARSMTLAFDESSGVSVRYHLASDVAA
jgi:hypothetical protein